MFQSEPPTLPHAFGLDAERVYWAIAMFPLFEEANAASYDLSPAGMARTGVDIVRCLATIIVSAPQPSSQPLDCFIGSALKLDAVKTDLARCLLILSADHGFEPSTYAVRAVATSVVTPWRSVATGLLIVTGRRSRFGHLNSRRSFSSRCLREPTCAA